MWKVLSVLFVFAVSVSAQTATISSTDWEFQQIVNSLVERENRVKDLNAKLLPKIDAAIKDLQANGALSLTVEALKKVRAYLVDLSTVSSYGAENTTLTCTDLAAKIASIQYDILRCYRIKFEVDVNATLLLVQWGNLNTAFVANYLFMTDNQRRDVQSILTSLYLLVDEYNQYGLTLLMAAYKYARLYIELVFCKKTYCSCPVALSANSTTALATVDKSIVEIQTTIDKFEADIRALALNITNQIAAVNPSLKTNSLFVLLTSTLDSITTLMSGYLKLTTNDIINATITCDDAAMKVAFIEYKIELYYQTELEAAKNATFVLFHLNNLVAYYAANTFYFSEAQKQSLQSIIATMTSLVDKFGQYILNLCISISKLLLMYCEAKFARMASCNCTEITNGTTIPPTTSE